MVKASIGAFALLLSAVSIPATAAVSVTDPIKNPAGEWAGIDYWGIQMTRTPTFDQTLTFDVPEYSKIDLFMGGSPKFQFTDILLNGTSIASNLKVNGGKELVGSGYADAASVSLRFMGNYGCSDCWSDWFGGYVQVTKSQMPSPPPSGAIPEPATWALIIGGFALAGATLRRSKLRRPQFG